MTSDSPSSSILVRWRRRAQSWGALTLPHALAALTFLAGAVLLFSGAVPTAGSRLAWLDKMLPLSVIETSHFLASLIGVALMLLARGLQRRINAAFYLTAALLAAGIVASLLKGLRYEGAILLALPLVALLTCRHRFARRASIFDVRLTPAWIAALAAVLVTAAWLVLFAYRNEAYAAELWWRFALEGEAPRSLRALVGAAVFAFAGVAAFLFRSAPPEPDPPTPQDLDHAAEIIAEAPRAVSHLALLGDKSLLFDQDRKAFLTYAVEGRSWVTLGGPVGPEDRHQDLLWRFRDLVERHGGWPVFYQVTDRHLPRYVDLGLSLIKLGEEGLVPLEGFSLEGGRRKDLRQALRKLEKEGLTFDWLPATAAPTTAASATEAPGQIEELRRISNAWLSDKNTREKGFSLGFFDPAYLARFPIAVVRSDERILAFTNVLRGGQKLELTCDLIRYVPEAPRGVMDFLFTHLMLWGAAEGYRSFSLGMAPLSGIEERPGAPMWNQLGARIYRYGEHFYNFKGLRAFKDKYDPRWEPRYLASPGGLPLPQILTNVAILIAGGVRGVFSR